MQTKIEFEHTCMRGLRPTSPMTTIATEGRAMVGSTMKNESLHALEKN
jgi:hypothetical protein